MTQPIMVACDLHDKTMVLKIAMGMERPEKMTVANHAEGRRKLIAELRTRAQAAGGARVVFAYEASGLGFGLHDELTDGGIESHVLAPGLIPRSVQHGRNKTDDRDADQILDVLRGHVLAGNRLPDVWIPDRQTRDDRELVRSRLDVATKIGRLKSQVQSLLKRNHTSRPEGTGEGWSQAFWSWLSGLARVPARKTEDSGWGIGTRQALASLLRQITSLEKEQTHLNKALRKLASSERYRASVERLREEFKGVGCLTALVFLTEVGDLGRFANRRQIGAYLGLVPSAHESGQRNDVKGHITRQGPSRVRKVLCQAVWSRIRYDAKEAEVYKRLVRKNPKHKKIAVVAGMRRLAIRMWHIGREVQPKVDSGGGASGPSSLPRTPTPFPLPCCP